MSTTTIGIDDVGRCFQQLLDSLATDEELRVDEVHTVGGGYSRTTWTATASTPLGGKHRFVLRADPIVDDGPFQSDRDDEWALLRSLARAEGIRIPEPRWYDESARFFPTKTIVSDFVGGGTLQSLLTTGAASDARGLDLLVGTLADIHATPIESLPLDHPGSWDTYMDRVLDRARRLAHDASSTAPILAGIVPWLIDNRPEPVPLTLVHGDFQPGNLLLDPAGVRVIDWEFAKIGDPREDLGYYRNYPVPPNLYERDADLFLSTYRDRTGLDADQVDTASCGFFLIVSLLDFYRQIWECAGGIADGTRHNLLGGYLINTLSHLNLVFSAVMHEAAT